MKSVNCSPAASRQKLSRLKSLLDDPEFGVPLIEEAGLSVTGMGEVNNNLFGGIGGGSSTWRATNMRSGVFGGDGDNSLTSLKHGGSDNEDDDEFIAEKIAGFTKELSEKAPIVEIVQNAFSEKQNLNCD